MRAPVSRFERWGALILLFALIPVGTFIGRELKPGGFFDRQDEWITIMAEDGLDLSAGDKVTMKGIQIGEVETLELADSGQVVIKCTIYQRYRKRVTLDAVVYLVPPAIVGRGEIEIQPGTGPRATQFQGEKKPSMEDQINVLIADVSGIIKKTDTQVIEFGRVLKKFQATLDSLNGLLLTVAEGKGSLGKIVVDEALYDRINSIVVGLERLPAMVKTIEEPLLKHQIPELAERIISMSRHAESVLARLEEGLEVFPQATTRVLVLLKEGRKVLESVKRNALIRGNLPADPVPTTMAPASSR